MITTHRTCSSLKLTHPAPFALALLAICPFAQAQSSSAVALKVAMPNDAITTVLCTQGDAVTLGKVAWVNVYSLGGGTSIEVWDPTNGINLFAATSGTDPFIRHLLANNSVGGTSAYMVWQEDGPSGSGIYFGNALTTPFAVAVDTTTTNLCLPTTSVGSVDFGSGGVCPDLYVATLNLYSTTAGPTSSSCDPQTISPGALGIVINQSVGSVCSPDSDFCFVSPGQTSAPSGGVFWKVDYDISIAPTLEPNLPLRVGFVADAGSSWPGTTRLFVGLGRLSSVQSFVEYAAVGSAAPGLSAMFLDNLTYATPTINWAGAVAFSGTVSCSPGDATECSEVVGETAYAAALWLKPRDPSGSTAATIPVVYPGRPISLDGGIGTVYFTDYVVPGISHSGNACKDPFAHATPSIKGADIGHALNGTDQLAFIATYCVPDKIYGPRERVGLFGAVPTSSSSVRIDPIVTFPWDPANNPFAPGTADSPESSNHRFVSIDDKWINNAGDVAFRATLDDDRTGVWMARSTGDGTFAIDLLLLEGQDVQIGESGVATLVDFLPFAIAGDGEDGRNIVFNDQRMFVVQAHLFSSSFPTATTRYAVVVAFPVPFPPSCDMDLNCDGNVDQDDIAYLINVIGGGSNPCGIDPDLTQDGNADQDDVAACRTAVAGGPCP